MIAPVTAYIQVRWSTPRSIQSAMQAFSPVVGIGSPRHLTRKQVLPPLWIQGGIHLLAGEGVGGADSNEGTDILVL